MNLPDTQYFLLVYPICLMLIGAVFVVAHLCFKAPQYLLWMGLSCILPSVALGAQTLMTNVQLKLTAPWFALFYLGGAWAVAHGMLLKANSRLNIFVASLFVIAAMASLLYFKYIDEQLWLRIVIINIVILCLEALALPKVYALLKRTEVLEKLLCFSYFLLVAYAVIRTLIVIVYLQNVQMVTLATTKWWMMMIAVNILLSLWFAIVVSAVAVKERFSIINEERLKDPLTQLYNRNGFLEKTEDLFKKMQHGEVYLVMCDVDHFKIINDTWGHTVGDKILCTIADICRSNIREGDVIGRYGGEEFIILLQSSDEKSSLALVERLRKKIEDQLFINNIKATVSFGAARIDTESQFISALEIADKRLYKAKNAGRNRVCFN
ncbi:diguanylate cyclase [Acinetobacter sp. SM34]|uniref:GGDEF domain-containing protein n=1 Tax=Acinetobacter sp. SM34 TaxID=1301620 RepID=UPI001EDB582F|nr:diguanylate cyclase [Acinetobacter sp. SM34]